MKRLFIAAVLVASLFTPQYTLAAGVRVASDVSTTATDTFTDNQYFIGGRVVADGTMQQDVLLLGGRTTLSGTVEGDALIFGGESTVLSGIVKGDARIFSGDVLLTGTVTGDVVVVGGTVRIAPEAIVQGELLLVGGSTTIDAALHKHARIVAGAVMLGGEVKNSANVTTQDFTITSTARVPGTIVYFAPQEAEQQPGAEVTGSVSFNRIDSIQESGIIEQAVVNFLNFWIVLRFVTTLLLTFLLVYIFRVFSQRATEYVLKSFGRSVLTGLLALLAVPIISVVLFASLILMPVSVLLMLVYVFVAVLASAVASIAVGALINRAFGKQHVLEVSFKTAALGVVLLTVVQFVPLVGEATRFVFFLAALGAVWRYVYEHIRWREMNLFDRHQ